MKELTNKEKEQFKDFTAHVEDYWGEFMKKLASMKKTHYNANIKSFTKKYECEEYTCDAHPRGCFFCKHCTDIWVDPFSGPYMWQCNVEMPTKRGIRGKCIMFEEQT